MESVEKFFTLNHEERPRFAESALMEEKVMVAVVCDYLLRNRMDAAAQVSVFIVILVTNRN